PVSPIAQFQPRALPSGKEDATETPSNAQDNSLFLPRLERLLTLRGADFAALFRGSPLKRAKWRGLVRNACIAAGNSNIRRGSGSHARGCDALKKLAACGDSIVAESAQSS